MDQNYILVLYYSRHGAVRNLAEQVALGAESSGQLEARLRTVPEVTTEVASDGNDIPAEGDLYVELDDLRYCSGLALGSPAWFGSMAAPMKHFLDQTTSLWVGGDLEDKPACVFTSSSSLHGGQESTLLSMMLPLLHHGMVFAGLPYSLSDLNTTQSGGSPYGATHWAAGDDAVLSAEEKRLAFEQGKRLANLALKLA